MPVRNRTGSSAGAGALAESPRTTSQTISGAASRARPTSRRGLAERADVGQCYLRPSPHYVVMSRVLAATTLAMFFVAILVVAVVSATSGDDGGGTTAAITQPPARTTPPTTTRAAPPKPKPV